MFSSIIKSRYNALRILPKLIKSRQISVKSQIQILNSQITSQQHFDCKHGQVAKFSIDVGSQIDPLKFEEVCEDTLESLCDYFEELIENSIHLKGADVTYGDGVLTVAFGEPYGTYVINRQSPNRQIWLSSPTSGPKRYDFADKNSGCWIYKHDGVPLHKLLQEEINLIVKTEVDFSKCSYSLV